MIHTQVYGFFQTCLPDQAKEVKEYFPNGKNSIRIRKTNGQEFIFFVERAEGLEVLKRSINFLST